MASKVSIITPIYQTEQYLETSLKALTNQTLKEIELIWIDNGANQACKDIIEAQKTANVKLITLAENIGYTGAINVGLEAATGDYIGFCDSDDWVDTDYYENLYKKANEASFDIVYCPFISERGNKRIVVPLIQKELKSFKGNLFDILNSGTIWNALFKKDFINKHNIKFPKTSGSIFRDEIFSIKAISATNHTAVTNDCFYHYRYNPASTTINISKEKEKQAIYEVIAEIFSDLSISKMEPDEQNALINFLFRPWCLASLREFPPEAKELTSLPHFKKQLKNARRFSHPILSDRFFSISHHVSKPIVKLRFLGISIKFKYKIKGEIE